jgi:hypothetical protein
VVIPSPRLNSPPFERCCAVGASNTTEFRV